MATATGLMTVEEFLALPDNGTDRWLINGQLRERPMTTRNRFHCRVMTCVATELELWLRTQAPPRGQVLTGDAGIWLGGDPGMLFGVDVVYASADLMANQPSDTTMIEGIPTLAVEILSPNDTIKDMNEKLDAFLDAGVPLVWVIDPYRQTVTAYRPGADPELFGSRTELSAEPVLPGFRLPVARLFE